MPTQLSRRRYTSNASEISFTQAEDGGFAPGQAVECGDARAILRAKKMLRDKAKVGSVAFSRRGNPDIEEYEPAVMDFGK